MLPGCAGDLEDLIHGDRPHSHQQLGYAVRGPRHDVAAKYSRILEIERTSYWVIRGDCNDQRVQPNVRDHASIRRNKRHVPRHLHARRTLWCVSGDWVIRDQLRNRRHSHGRIPLEPRSVVSARYRSASKSDRIGKQVSVMLRIRAVRGSQKHTREIGRNARGRQLYHCHDERQDADDRPHALGTHCTQTT